MAGRGYLGKISAILTADSKGLSRGLNAGAKDVTQFARKIQSTISGATSRAGREFDNILTPLQKLQRALKVGVGQNLKLVNQQEVQAIRQFAEAAERIAKPVSQAAKDFAGLSTQVQRNFAPALESAQKAAEQLRTAIGNGARVGERDFANLEARINRVTQAASRLREAGQATAGLASGQELRFQRPGFLQQTSRAAALQQQAAALSPEQIQGSGVAALVGQQRQAAQEAANLLSTLERIRATRNGDAQSAEAAYSRQVAALRLVNDQLEREITLSQQAANAQREAAADAQRRAEAASRFLNVDQRESNLLASQGQQQDVRAYLQLLEESRVRTDALTDAQRRAEAASRFLNVDQRESNLIANEGQQQDIREYIQLLEQARARTEALADAQRRAEAASRFLVVDQRESNLIASEGQQTDVRAYLQLLEDARVRTEALADAQRRAEAASRFLNVDQRGSDLLSNQGAASRVNPQQAFLGRVGGEITAVRNQLRELPGVAAELGPTVDNLTTRWQNLGRAGVGFTAEQLRTVQQETRNIQDALTSRNNTANDFSRQFGGGGPAGIALGIDERQLRGIGAEFEFLQGRLAGVSSEARGPLVAAMEQYRQVATRSFRDGTASTQQGRRAIAQAREEVVRLAAAVLNVRPGRLAQDLARVGDVARGSFGNAGLVIQQAVFAIDDFFSVTGGLDQRIRAAGNNISQLGFIVGGTAGLIAGVFVSALAQGVAALIKFSNAGVGSEDRVKALNDALAKQKTLVEELAQAYKSLAESIARSSLSQRAQRREEIKRQVDEIRKKQDEQVREREAGVNPEIQRQRGIQAARQAELDKTEDPARRLLLQAQIEASKAAERRLLRNAVERPGISPLEAARQTVESRRRFEEARLPANEGDLGAADRENAVRLGSQQLLREIEAQLGGAGSRQEQFNLARDFVLQEQARLGEQAASSRGAFGGQTDASAEAERQFLALSRVLNDLERDLTRSTNAAAVEAADRALAAGDLIGEAQTRIAKVLGDSGSAIGQQADALGERLSKLTTEIESAQIAGDLGRVDAAKAEVEAIAKQAEAIRAASTAVEQFAEVLDRARQEADQNLQQSQSDADQARRADLGVSTARSREEAAATSAAFDRQVASSSQVRKAIALAQERFNRDVAAGGDSRGTTLQKLAARAAEIDKQLLQGNLAPEMRDALIREREASRVTFLRQDEDVQAALDADTRLRQQSDLAARGRDLRMTPVQRAAEQVTQDAEAIIASAPLELRAALNRLAEQRMQQEAPMLAGFREERMNAMLQGPSRAALNVADAQTMEGNRELNRLLRGDDPNKDVNLVELQKQSELLQGVIDAINERVGQDIVEIRG
jgi:hypothetical protein